MNRFVSTLLVSLLSMVLGLACSGRERGPLTGPSDPTGPTDPTDPMSRVGFASVSGTVWAPGNAPSLVPAGQEIPIANALVYVSTVRPGPIPSTVYCEPCIDPPLGSALSDAQGRFSVTAIVPGDYWLVIQKGQFRLEQPITIGENDTIELDAVQTTLPSTHDPENGSWVPRIALASGVYDSLEDVLGKMGLGDLGSDGSFVGSSAAGVFDVYSNGGAIDGSAIGSLADLVRDLNRMRQYHVIFIPCSGDMHTDVLSDQQVLRNIRTYVSEGGKLYVTDWSGEWADNVFPAQVELVDDGGGIPDPFGFGFGGPIDTPSEAFDPATETWDTSLFGNADDSNAYDSEHGEAIDPDLHAWLHGQSGPDAESGSVVTFDASDMHITGSWDHIADLHTVPIGVDEEGLTIFDEPYAWVIGDDGDATKNPLTVTYEPVGCGRVLYTTYHTTEHSHDGLVPQERILLYLIMEIGVCKSGPILI